MGEFQLRFMGGLSDVDWLVEEGLKDINSDSSRWSFPFVARREAPVLRTCMTAAGQGDLSRCGIRAVRASSGSARLAQWRLPLTENPTKLMFARPERNGSS